MHHEQAPYKRPGQLDPVFGTGGIVKLDNDEIKKNRINGIAVGPDNKIYITGDRAIDFIGQNMFLGRLDANTGLFDKTFNGTGIIHHDNTRSIGTSILFQTEGKVLVVGRVGLDTAVFRYKKDGSLDLEFGTDGVVVILPPDDLVSTASGTKRSPDLSSRFGGGSPTCAAHLLAEDKILLITKREVVVGRYHSYICVLNSDGSNDLTFNRTGDVKVAPPHFDPVVVQLTNVTVQSDQYVGCGAIWDRQNPHEAMFVRYENNGIVDTSFGEKGFVTIQSPAENKGVRIEYLVKQNNGFILGIGDDFADFGSGVLVSLDTNGKPNNNFNNGQPLYTQLEKNSSTYWTGGGQVQLDGKVVVAGGVGGFNSKVDIVVARFTNQGTFDTDFNEKGWVRTHLDLPEPTQNASAMTLHKDQAIIVAASAADNPNGIRYSLILRYLQN